MPKELVWNSLWGTLFSLSQIPFLSFHFLFRTTTAAHGSSQARGWIRAAAEVYATTTATSDPSHICYLYSILWQHWIFNPLSKTRDWTCILTDTGQILTHWDATGTPKSPCFFFLFFLGPHPRHMEVPRLGVELELQLLAYASAIATQDPSQVCDLPHSSGQHWIDP